MCFAFLYVQRVVSLNCFFSWALVIVIMWEQPLHFNFISAPALRTSQTSLPQGCFFLLLKYEPGTIVWLWQSTGVWGKSFIFYLAFFLVCEKRIEKVYCNFNIYWCAKFSCGVHSKHRNSNINGGYSKLGTEHRTYGASGAHIAVSCMYLIWDRCSLA